MIRIGFCTGVIEFIVLEEKIGVSACSKSGFVTWSAEAWTYSS